MNELEALAAAQAAVFEKPHNAAAWCQLGVAHFVLAGPGPDHYLEAHNCFERAFTMAPHVPAAVMAMASSVFTLGHHQQALELFRQAQTMGPNPSPMLSEAGILLLLGQYEEGWRKFEARLGNPKPLPDLADLAGRTVIVRSEQAFGDTIEFMRYVPQLSQFCDRVVVEVHPGLEELVQAFLTEQVVTAPTFVRGDISIPMMSLPLLLGPKIGWEPIRKLGVPSHLHVPHRSGVGICPASLPLLAEVNPFHAPMCRRKTPPPEMVEELAADFGPFQSLMHEDMGTETWMQTAEIMRHLDLVITVDTGVAHLAASMGIDTWLMQRFDHCWRWNYGWYSNVRIFKQSHPGNWPSVFEQVYNALKIRYDLLRG